MFSNSRYDLHTIFLFQQIKYIGKRIKKVFFHMIWILMGKSQCYIQFLSLAYEEELSDLNVVPATLQRLLGICYTDLGLLKLACC